MGTLTVTIKADNAAFDSEPGVELARILRHLAQEIEFEGLFSPDDPDPVLRCPATTQYLFDVNGNTVGQARWKGGK